MWPPQPAAYRKVGHRALGPVVPLFWVSPGGNEVVLWVLLLLGRGTAKRDTSIPSRPPDGQQGFFRPVVSPLWRVVFAQGREEIGAEQVEGIFSSTQWN